MAATPQTMKATSVAIILRLRKMDVPLERGTLTMAVEVLVAVVVILNVKKDRDYWAGGRVSVVFCVAVTFWQKLVKTIDFWFYETTSLQKSDGRSV
mmetsp:Transcript_29829/g.72265  ORF Transcript_29829/g.72265 Transcript_29829/m.72265 type:complete len:96 (-) Transcript_29829:389-676(-)